MTSIMPYKAVTARISHAREVRDVFLLRISLRFEHSVGACTGSLWFVRAIDLY